MKKKELQENKDDEEVEMGFYPDYTAVCHSTLRFICWHEASSKYVDALFPRASSASFVIHRKSSSDHGADGVMP